MWGFEHAIRGMRNPLDSHAKSDSIFSPTVKIGENDMNLAKRLIAGGPEHRKFLRQIMVSVDITGGLFWFKEFDTYKIGTTANSSSTMHTIMRNPITMDNFEMDDYSHMLSLDKYKCVHGDEAEFVIDDAWEDIITICNKLRDKYLETKDKRYWKELIRILPESWLQTRTVTMNYENLYSIVRQRTGHKLTEWAKFIEWASSLPYANEFLMP